MKHVFFSFILFLTVLVQVSFVSLPLAMSALLLFAILFQDISIFIYAFVFGIILDVLSFHPIGLSSLFFIGSLGIVFIYKRKFELQSLFFVGVSIFLFSLLYSSVFFHHDSLKKAIISSVMFGGMYWIIALWEQRRNPSRI